MPKYDVCNLCSNAEHRRLWGDWRIVYMIGQTGFEVHSYILTCMNTAYYTIYQITNNLNNKIYVGCHRTQDLNDDYMGSGVRIIRAIAKHGIENFTKEYTHVFESPEEMYEAEARIVNKEFLQREDVYNLTEGGHGGWHFSEEIKKKISIALLGKKRSEEHKQKLSAAALGKKRTPISKEIP